MVLYHAPGETNDQIIVHWPEEGVLCPADNIYRAFPNLYAVRGTAARYVIAIFFISNKNNSTNKKAALRGSKTPSWKTSLKRIGPP